MDYLFSETSLRMEIKTITFYFSIKKSRTTSMLIYSYGNFILHGWWEIVWQTKEKKLLRFFYVSLKDRKRILYFVAYMKLVVVVYRYTFLFNSPFSWLIRLTFLYSSTFSWWMRLPCNKGNGTTLDELKNWEKRSRWGVK